MDFKLYEFFMGLFIANSIPHLIFGIMDIRFLSLFGFSALGNKLYSVFCVLLAMSLSMYFNQSESLLNNSIFLGVFFIYISFVICGRFLYLTWKSAPEKN